LILFLMLFVKKLRTVIACRVWFSIFFTCFEIRVLFIFLSVDGFVSVCLFLFSRNEVLMCFYRDLLVFFLVEMKLQLNC
jgi:hypothetical protein